MSEAPKGFHFHPNGGGLVEDTAVVGVSAFVGPEARVLGQALVSHKATICDRAVVSGKAWVGNTAAVYDNAWVGENAIVSGDARVFDNTHVFENARVEGSARVYGKAKVFGSAIVRDKAHVTGNAQVSDYAEVFGKAKVSGNTIVSGIEKVSVERDITITSDSDLIVSDPIEDLFETTIDYKFNEGQLVQELQEYINSTYNQHYATDKYQATDMIIDSGHGVGFCVGNIMKYAKRYGKKGGPSDQRKDLMKILHYGIILLNEHDVKNA